MIKCLCLFEPNGNQKKFLLTDMYKLSLTGLWLVANNGWTFYAEQARWLFVAQYTFLIYMPNAILKRKFSFLAPIYVILGKLEKN